MENLYSNYNQYKFQNKNSKNDDELSDVIKLNNNFNININKDR